MNEIKFELESLLKNSHPYDSGNAESVFVEIQHSVRVVAVCLWRKLLDPHLLVMIGDLNSENSKDYLSEVISEEH